MILYEFQEEILKLFKERFYKEISLNEFILDLDMKHDPYVIVTYINDREGISFIPSNLKNSIGIIKNFYNPHTGSVIYTYDYIRSWLLDNYEKSVDKFIKTFLSQPNMFTYRIKNSQNYSIIDYYDIINSTRIICPNRDYDIMFKLIETEDSNLLNFFKNKLTKI